MLKSDPKYETEDVKSAILEAKFDDSVTLPSKLVDWTGIYTTAVKDQVLMNFLLLILWRTYFILGLLWFMLGIFGNSECVNITIFLANTKSTNINRSKSNQIQFALLASRQFSPLSKLFNARLLVMVAMEATLPQLTSTCQEREDSNQKALILTPPTTAQQAPARNSRAKS